MQHFVGPDAMVCVCNSTYCDTVDTPQLQTNQFQLYTSTKSGQRLQLTIANLSNKPFGKETLLIVDSKQKYQEIHGFGGALTDAAALNIRNLSSTAQQKLFEYTIDIIILIKRNNSLEEEKISILLKNKTNNNNSKKIEQKKTARINCIIVHCTLYNYTRHSTFLNKSFSCFGIILISSR